MEITVRDADDWFSGGGDDVASATFTFDEAGAICADSAVHLQDSSGLRLRLFIRGREPGR